MYTQILFVYFKGCLNDRVLYKIADCIGYEYRQLSTFLGVLLKKVEQMEIQFKTPLDVNHAILKVFKEKQVVLES